MQHRLVTEQLREQLNAKVHNKTKMSYLKNLYRSLYQSIWYGITILEEGKVVAKKIFELNWSSIVLPAEWKERLFVPSMGCGIGYTHCRSSNNIKT